MTLSANLILESLPHPVIVVDHENCVRATNPAGEDLLQHSAEVLNGTPLTDYVPADNPLISLIDVARSRQNSASEFDVHLESPRIGVHSVTAHVSPLLHTPKHEGSVIISLLPRGMTATLDQQLTNINAGRSMSSMGSMLAHEIKNPLAGMKGAAEAREPQGQHCRWGAGRRWM